MKKHQLSIIIPVYNAENLIESLLQNLLDQKFKNFEIIFIDGKSNDATLEKINSYSKNCDRILYFSEVDLGIYDAMNRGILKSNGIWLYFMGADDRLFDDEVLLKIFEINISEFDLVYGDVIWYPEQVIESGYCGVEQLLQRNINHQRIFYRKELFELYGSYNLKYHIASDHDLNVRFFCNPRIRKQYVPQIVANYHSGGYSSKNIDEVFWDDWEMTIYQRFKAFLPDKIVYNNLAWYCWYNIEQKKYLKAFRLFFKIFFHNRSLGFASLTFFQLFKKNKHAI